MPNRALVLDVPATQVRDLADGVRACIAGTVAALAPSTRRLSINVPVSVSARSLRALSEVTRQMGFDIF